MVCPACGFAVAPAAKFCAECGQRLNIAAPPVQAEETLPAPQVYTPRYLAEKILASRVALTGERKQVTVLFADIKDSTELIRGLDPEVAQQLLDPALQHMMAAVHPLRAR
jgi:class 3 adenylate cyclase